MPDHTTPPPSSFIYRVIRFCLHKKLVVLLVTALFIGWGLLVAPFDWNVGGLLRSPVPIDAIPDIGENQQIVFTEWPGRSPQDMEDQVTYPLTVSLMGIPGVKTIRSYSMFSFSTVYVIFEDDVEFYWGRTRILEKLNSLPRDTLPEAVQPVLGPDATAMGQVFWYTLEGRDSQGNPTGGWDPHELRSIQDWYVRYALLAAEGVSEVASVGGFVQEYQVDIDPDRMRARNVTLNEVISAVRSANREVGARTIEINRVGYIVRGIGFLKNTDDLADAVIKMDGGVPIFVRNLASVTLGPALRTGALDKGGLEAVGGVVVVRYGENPLTVIKQVKKKIDEISPGLPQKTLPDGTVSHVRIVPFYDRTDLIHQTLGTLETALTHEILVTIIVVLLMARHLAGSLLIAGMLPLAVLLCFITMKIFNVQANIVALSGIAIAIGTMVDMGIILTENILSHLRSSNAQERRIDVIIRASGEVGGAVLTAISTTIISFLPVFTLAAAEGKLFRPLAFTKTFALFASLIVAVVLIPPIAHLLFGKGGDSTKPRNRIFFEGLIYLGAVMAFVGTWWVGLSIAVVGGCCLIASRFPQHRWKWMLESFPLAVVVTLLLSHYWMPLGPEKGYLRNLIFVTVLIGGWLGFLEIIRHYYQLILRWCLGHKKTLLGGVSLLLIWGAVAWFGLSAFLGWVPREILSSRPVSYVTGIFPGLGREFMPPLDEGSFLFMPSIMPHASITEALDVLQKQDRAIQALPEVESVVGKLGRADSALDPAPISMIETVVNYYPRYVQGEEGNLRRYRFSPDELDLARTAAGDLVYAPDGQPYLVRGKFARNENFELILDPEGRPFSYWRPAVDPDLNPGRTAWEGIQRPDDIWDAIVRAARLPGTTTAARLQPISARMVMLQSGIRSSMGIRISGPDLETIQNFSLEIEKNLRAVPSVDPDTVIADRIMGKPYIEIHPDHQAIAQYGVTLEQVQDVIEFAVGGRRITTTVEGRERYPVRVRYLRELRDDLESLGKVLIPGPGGVQLPLSQLAEFRYVRGPEVIKSEGSFLVGYVLFDKLRGFPEGEVVEEIGDYLKDQIVRGRLQVPAGVSYSFTGTYENQVRSEKWLAVILPITFFIIFIILYLQFNSVVTTSLVFSSVFVSWAGAFIMLWFYAQPWFLDFGVFGTSMRDLFQIHPINLSVAVWVGFLALFGIASDDSVVMATYLDQKFAAQHPHSVEEIRQATIDAGSRRIRPCLMTTATTVLALLPVLTSTGRGSDIMIPMAIPSFGGMMVAVVTMLVTPVLYCGIKEHRLRREQK